MNFKKEAADWPSTEQVEKLRKELSRRIAREDLERVWHQEAVDRLIDLAHMEPSTFQRLWIDPLVEAGVSLEVAIVCVVQSYLQPN